jgi:hypothetical protein
MMTDIPGFMGATLDVTFSFLRLGRQTRNLKVAFAIGERAIEARGADHHRQHGLMGSFL